MKRFPEGHELRFEAVRSRGPGGQNVNKTNSAAILRWHLPSTSMAAPLKERLLEKLGSKLTGDGEIMIRGEEHRDLESNKRACIDRLRDMIERALFRPKTRIKTKPGKGAVRRRLDTKKKHGEKKRQRSKSSED